MIPFGAKEALLRRPKALNSLVAAGNRVSANVTLSRLNVDKIEETTEIAKDDGFLRDRFFHEWSHAGGEKPYWIVFSPLRELKSAYQKIISLNRPSFEVVSGDPLAGTLFETKPSLWM